MLEGFLDFVGADSPMHVLEREAQTASGCTRTCCVCFVEDPVQSTIREWLSFDKHRIELSIPHIAVESWQKCNSRAVPRA
eukprot:scaffold11998_cov174-Amphora_coffeaeformis.AAC.15